MTERYQEVLNGYYLTDDGLQEECKNCGIALANHFGMFCPYRDGSTFKSGNDKEPLSWLVKIN